MDLKLITEEQPAKHIELEHLQEGWGDSSMFSFSVKVSTETMRNGYCNTVRHEDARDF